ncbi:YceD family protein [Streptococcus halichoeri]|uniref:YceD family protein n=1 Tax=Streptococcus halichoeri TaxID=254785 RepID=UPI00135CC54C|nr:YceD family protein [Streptococcus halichoeri]
MLLLSDIKKHPQGISFHEELDISAAIMQRHKDIRAITKPLVEGFVRYENGLYLLQYHMSYTITLPSSRSMVDVPLPFSEDVQELFIEAAESQARADMVEENLVMILESDQIHLVDSVIDNILLNIPLQVLSTAEEASDVLPSGQDWTVMTENQYQSLKAAKEAANNPFASLEGMFDE